MRIWHQHRHGMIACDGNDLIWLHLLDYTHSEPCVFKARCHATAPLLLHLYNLPHAHPIHHHQKNLAFRSLHFRCVYLLRCRGTKHFYYCHTGVLTRAIPIRTHSRINYETIRRPNRTKAKIKKNQEKKIRLAKKKCTSCRNVQKGSILNVVRVFTYACIENKCAHFILFMRMVQILVSMHISFVIHCFSFLLILFFFNRISFSIIPKCSLLQCRYC